MVRTYAYVTLNVKLGIIVIARLAAVARLKIKQRQIAARRLSNEGYFSLTILKLQCARAVGQLRELSATFLRRR